MMQHCSKSVHEVHHWTRIILEASPYIKMSLLDEVHPFFFFKLFYLEVSYYSYVIFIHVTTASQEDHLSLLVYIRLLGDHIEKDMQQLELFLMDGKLNHSSMTRQVKFFQGPLVYLQVQSQQLIKEMNYKLSMPCKKSFVMVLQSVTAVTLIDKLDINLCDSRTSLDKLFGKKML